jgi:predicted O-methyltransferase YrrM
MEIPVRWGRKSQRAWLARRLPNGSLRPAVHPLAEKIERLASSTDRLGPQPLWQGYAPQGPGTVRLPSQVRIPRLLGNWFAELASQRKPSTVVEFGTAFGVSGMYWLAGIQSNGRGQLLAFEPNERWAAVARQNLSAIGKRFILQVGTFEQHIDQCLAATASIDIAFVDAIHRSEFVLPQLEMVVARCSPGALIILDDINFSPDMVDCWRRVSSDRRFIASAVLAQRLGIVELSK